MFCSMLVVWLLVVLVDFGLICLIGILMVQWWGFFWSFSLVRMWFSDEVVVLCLRVVECYYNEGLIGVVVGFVIVGLFG